MTFESHAETVAQELDPTPSELEPDRILVAASTSPLRDSLRRFTRDRRAMVSLGILLFLFIGSFVFLPIYEHIGGIISVRSGFIHIGPSDYHNPVPSVLGEHTDEGPSVIHWLGTDDQGRDLFARVMAGIQVSVIVAVLVVGVLDVGLGVLFGVLAGYYGGIIDSVLARFTDIVFAFPGLLFAFLISAIFGGFADQQFGASGRLILVSLALGITIWPQMARYVRGQTLQLKNQQFIEASRTIGTTSVQIITRHILPNIASLIIIAATLDVSTTIINEGVLSLLGLGVQPPGASLGRMISDSAAQIPYYPWEDLLPAITMIIIVLSLSFIGDGVRDAFDPRSKD